jgi:hypothetical protein
MAPVFPPIKAGPRFWPVLRRKYQKTAKKEIKREIKKRA